MRARLATCLALMLALSACLPFGGGERSARGAATEGAVEGSSPLAVGTVSVTTLDTPPAAAPATGTTEATPAPATLGTAKGTPTPPPPRPGTSAAPAAADATDPDAAPPAEEPPPPPPKSAAQIDCEGRGGTWGRAGDSIAMTCFRKTRDAGKSCRRESDCSTLCLARSRSCAPVTPLFGCHQILQDDGRAVTLCLD